MKKARKPEPPAADELQAEYAFDYGKARPNRFASRVSDSVVAVVLEPIPSASPQAGSRKPRRKAG